MVKGSICKLKNTANKLKYLFQSEFSETISYFV